MLMDKTKTMLFLAGTSAEAIKLSPIVRRLHQENLDFGFIWTGQHVNAADQSFNFDFLPIKAVSLTRGWFGKNPVNVFQFSFWYLWMNLLLSRYLLRNRPKLLVIHGDTLSALAGAYVGKFFRIQVAHVEAGYRNVNRWTPFPEEITRRMISRLATFHFAPGKETVQNLLSQGISKDLVFDTFDNTAIDNLYDLEIKSAREGYGVVTLHRTELLSDRKLLVDTFQALNNYAVNQPICVVADHRLIHALNALPLQYISNLKVIPKMKYLEFINYVSKADFVVTDSGGLRQEMEHLGKPLIIHRANIEYQTSGISSLRLTNWDTGKLIEFMKNNQQLATESVSEFSSPSSEIVRILRLFIT